MRNKPKEPLILRSELTQPPRYYVTHAYKTRPSATPGKTLVEVTGKKWDVTEQIEQIIREALIEPESVKE